MIVTQLLILMGCLTGGTIVKSSDDATEVIQLWLNSHEGVEAVKFEFRHNYYIISFLLIVKLLARRIVRLQRNAISSSFPLRQD
ncbi:MAG TPA: hypothetical protein DIW81_03290 [Planctomycetaceae bacterium]|nr:hypothetical protein [Rubinisphaera sp.]HCS50607.1 hypothetical protein [Planctomycetaceae bacterium]